MRYCVVGAGRWDKNHIRTCAELGVLSAVIDSDAARLADIQATYPEIQTFQSLSDDGALAFDAYSIAVPAEYHFDCAKTCIEAGKSVLIEKPITLTSDDAETLGALAQQHGVQVLVGHLLLFHPAFVKMKSLVDSGKLGNVQYIYLSLIHI